MLAAIDIEGKKRIPYLEDIDTLRVLSKTREIYCPECLTPVKLAAGNRRAPHYKHYPNVECSYESEPESAEHVQGKIRICKWLEQKYPEARIELEYKIQETNQRADVMAIFPEGEKWAFEMQCSPIQGKIWKQRTSLYKQAGIKDFWIVDENLHSFGKTDGEVDKMKHRLRDLPLTIFQENGWLVFLNTSTDEITSFNEFEDDIWSGNSTLYTKGNQFMISELRRIKHFLGNDQIELNYYKRLEEIEKSLREEKEEKKRQREIKNKQIKAARDYQSELRNFDFGQVASKMTKNEKILFKTLIKKYNLNKQSFPGICKIHVEYMELISTPYPLWQLYIYDKYVYPSNNGKTNLWIPNILNDIKKQFRTTWDTENDAHWSFAIYRYFEALGKTKRLKRLSKKNSKYFQVISNELPDFNSFKYQSYIAYYLSHHSAVVIEEDKHFKDEVLETWMIYMKDYMSNEYPYYNAINNNKVLDNYNFLKQESKFPLVFDQYEQIQSMIHLYHKDPSCLSKEESEFLINFFKHLNTDKRINIHQWEQYTLVKRTLEKYFSFSLNM